MLIVAICIAINGPYPRRSGSTTHVGCPGKCTAHVGISSHVVRIWPRRSVPRCEHHERCSTRFGQPLKFGQTVCTNLVDYQLCLCQYDYSTSGDTPLGQNCTWYSDAAYWPIGMASIDTETAQYQFPPLALILTRRSTHIALHCRCSK